MSVMTLFKRSSNPQTLVKAPDADLIRPDNELVVPDPFVLTCMAREEFEAYRALTDEQFDNVSFIQEAILQILVKLDIRVYPNKKVDELLDKQVKYYRDKFDQEAHGTIWRPVTGQCKYERPIPVRIIKLMNQLQKGSGYHYFKGNTDPYGRFVISDIAKKYDHRIFAQDRSLICFLGIELWTTSGISSSYHRRYLNIIDAWRGPTFSDEEALLP